VIGTSVGGTAALGKIFRAAEIGPLLDLLVRRAGRYKRGVLETGLASSVRLMKDRVHLLAKLHAQSRNNPRTAHFLDAEIKALAQDIGYIQRMIPREAATTRKVRHPPKANRSMPLRSGRGGP
jgi:hypothetical protein